MRFCFSLVLCFFIATAPSWAAVKKHIKYIHPVHHSFPGSGSGLASLYGNREQGHFTASGERFDNAKFTAASRTLPFGLMIRVTSLKTKLSTIVRINDRGPWIATRILDLSQAAAAEIGCSGVCRINYVVVPEGGMNDSH